MSEEEIVEEQSVVRLENIYGQTPTPPETEESVKLGLELLQVELDAIGEEQKQGFNQALEKCPHLICDDFLLMFLRTEVFHAGRAAQRLVAYWDKRIEIFGETKAFMCLTLDEALADDGAALSLGFLRPTNQNDSCGRGVLFMSMSKAEYTRMGVVRAVWYAVHAALEDEKAQKYGFVVIVKPHVRVRDADLRLEKKLADHMNGVLPFRLGCFHICHPPLTINMSLKVARVFLPKKIRHRIRVHTGSHEEVLDSLATCGISKSAIPSIWDGEFKVDSHSEWLEARRLVENDRE